MSALKVLLTFSIKSDALNTILLSIGIVQMYNGIEIGHPVFRVLFCNLVAAFMSSVVNVIAYPVEKNIRYSTIVNGNNTFCLLFHCCCWLIVSILRFLYIIHKDWILLRFPEAKVLNRLVITSVFCTYLTCWLIVIFVCVLCGWPGLKLFEMPMPQRAIAVGTLLGIYILLLCVSCSFYLLIMRKRGSLRNNKVSSNTIEMKVHVSDVNMMTDQFGNVWTGDSQINDTHNQNDQMQLSSAEEVIVLN
jgi:hypothetical protein